MRSSIITLVLATFGYGHDSTPAGGLTALITRRAERGKGVWAKREREELWVVLLLVEGEGITVITKKKRGERIVWTGQVKQRLKGERGSM